MGATLSAAVLAIILLLPLASIIVLAFNNSGDAVSRMAATVLPGYLRQTLLLLFGLSIGTLLIGVPLAWLVTAYDFRGAKLLQWLAMLPMAMPTYIIAFASVEALSYSGPAQTWLRGVMGWTRPGDYSFPEIRSLGGAIVVLSLVLYPYVYLSARSAFLKQPQNQIDVSRTLGRTALQTVWSVVLPQARPALIVGLSLVLLEALNDIGAMNSFGVQTLTLAVYSTWLGQGNLQGAAQLALMLLLAVAAIIIMERHARGREHQLRQATKSPPLQPVELHGPKAALAFLAGLLPVLLGFVAPLLLLLSFALRRSDELLSAPFWMALRNSLVLAVLAAAITVALGLFFASALRREKGGYLKGAIELATQGYAIPGTVLGLGLIFALGRFDNWLSPLLTQMTGRNFGLLLSGSVVALLLAYVIRFMAMAYGSIDASLQKIPQRMDDVARTLRSSPWEVFRNIHLPLLKPALATGAIMVFVDSMKELPATLILRPFDFDTLATLAFTQASLDKLEASAAPALAIVLVGLLPVYLLARNLRQAG